MRMLFTHGRHFSFGIYLQTKPVANEMQGRSSTFPSKHVTLWRLSLSAAYYDGFWVCGLSGRFREFWEFPQRFRWPDTFTASILRIIQWLPIPLIRSLSLRLASSLIFIIVFITEHVTVLVSVSSLVQWWADAQLMGNPSRACCLHSERRAGR